MIIENEIVITDLVNIPLAKGEKGDKGDKGDKGEKGDKGDKGEKGEPAYDDTEIRSRISENETNISELQGENETNKTNISNLQTDNETNKSDIANLQTDNETNKSNILALQTDNETNKSNILSLQLDNEKNKFNISKIEEEQITQDTKIQTLEIETSINKSNISNLQTENEDNKTRISNIEAEQITQNEKIETLEKENETNKQDILDIQTKNTEQDTNIQNNAESIEELKAENERLNNDINAIVEGSSFSGKYEDLIGKPDLTVFAKTTDVTAKINTAISDRVTETQMNTAINAAVANINKKQIVTSISEMTNTDTIYLIANSGSENNIYDEYLVINGQAEKIGTTEVNLENYVQIEQHNELKAQIDLLIQRIEALEANKQSNIVLNNKEISYSAQETATYSLYFADENGTALSDYDKICDLNVTAETVSTYSDLNSLNVAPLRS